MGHLKTFSGSDIRARVVGGAEAAAPAPIMRWMLVVYVYLCVSGEGVVVDRRVEC